MWSGLWMQESFTPLMEQLIYFHDYAMMIMFMILSLIFYVVMFMFSLRGYNRILFHNDGLEIFWTFIPALVLLTLAFPSLHVLYLLEEEENPLLSVKCLGHQWYWSYEYSDFDSLDFDSYMVSDSLFRLLDVDNHVVLPIKTPIRFLTSSSDVIHSWAIPSAGMKMDANPGRINMMVGNFMRMGLMYGQCSEICGVLHSFMPIVVEIVPMKCFTGWVKSFN